MLPQKGVLADRLFCKNIYVRLDEWRERYPNEVEMSRFALVNLILNYVAGMGGYFPEANHPTLLGENHVSQRYHQWNLLRSAVHRSIGLTLIVSLGQKLHQSPSLLNPNFWWFMSQFSQVSDDDAANEQENHFDPEQVRIEQFLNSKEAYIAAEGPFGEIPPSPWEPDFEARVEKFPPGYRVEAQDTWKFLQSMSDEELRASFGKNEVSKP